MQYIFLYDRHFTGSIYLNKNRICEYLAAVWLCKSAFISISVSDTLCILKSNRKKQQDVIPPLIIMLCVTGTALVERTISLVQAFSAGTATFLVEGLQLIIAVLLMILGVIIVVNSLRAYFASKKNSETI